jgi:hypothetical protein
VYEEFLHSLRFRRDARRLESEHAVDNFAKKYIRMHALAERID